MAKSDNIFVRAKAYVKVHPRTSFQDAIQIVSKKKISGTKKKVSGVKRKVSGTKKVAGTVKRKRTTTHLVHSTSAPKHTIIERGKALIRQIDKLELQRKNEKNRDMKDIIQVEINKCHRKLREIKKSA